MDMLDRIDRIAEVSQEINRLCRLDQQVTSEGDFLASPKLQEMIRVLDDRRVSLFAGH
jgi:hypothetical protein